MKVHTNQHTHIRTTTTTSILHPNNSSPHAVILLVLLILLQPLGMPNCGVKERHGHRLLLMARQQPQRSTGLRTEGRGGASKGTGCAPRGTRTHTCTHTHAHTRARTCTSSARVAAQHNRADAAGRTWHVDGAGRPEAQALHDHGHQLGGTRRGAQAGKHRGLHRVRLSAAGALRPRSAAQSSCVQWSSDSARMPCMNGRRGAFAQ